MSGKRPVQGWAQRKRLDFFEEHLARPVKVIEVGSGSGWVKQALIVSGVADYTGLDLYPPADVVGDINKWRELGLEPDSFDTIIAFEVVEHVDCFDACQYLLKLGGKMLITTPAPSMDWLLKITEGLGLNQRRTSPHDDLVELRKVLAFEKKSIRMVLGLGQWAVFTKSQ